MKTAINIVVVLIGWMYLGACAPTPVMEVHSVGSDQFHRIVDNGNVQILDVRSQGEFAKGHLPNAINIDIKSCDFNSDARASLDRDMPVAVYCQSGKRSHIASGILLDMGYEVYELKDGVAGWVGPVAYGYN